MKLFCSKGEGGARPARYSHHSGESVWGQDAETLCSTTDRLSAHRKFPKNIHQSDLQDLRPTPGEPPRVAQVCALAVSICSIR